MSSLIKKPGGSLEKRDPFAYSDHGSFHGTVLRAMGGGAAGVFLAYLADWLLGLGLIEAALPIFIAAGVLAAVASRGKNVLKALIGGAFGALGGGLFVLTAGPWAPFAAALLGASAMPVLAEGESKKRKAVTAALTGALGSAGLYVGGVLLQAPILSALHLPLPLGAAIAGAAAGLFFGLGAAPKHLARPMDPVEAKYLEALNVKDGELHEILHRALTIQHAVKLDLEKRVDDETVKLLGNRITDLMLRILTIAEQCRTIEIDLSAAPAYELEERIAQLQKKAEAATDSAARRTYESAIASLDEQRRALQAIGRGRERVIAKLHANVALLEKVRFSLLHLRSADAERVGGESSPVAEALEELGREIDATSTAVSEVWGQTGDLLPPPQKNPDEEPTNVVALPEKTKVESDVG